ncbi:MAG: hypothetical protein QXL44_04850 [Candidatus Nitrosocaldus sp.]
MKWMGMIYTQRDLDAAPKIAALLSSVFMESRMSEPMTYLPVVTTSLIIDTEATVTIPPYMERGSNVNSLYIC